MKVNSQISHYLVFETILYLTYQKRKVEITQEKMSIKKSISFRPPSLSLQKEKKLDASALGYAITFLFLVGLVCTGVIFIASVNKRLELNYNMKEHVIMDNYLALKMGASLEKEEKKTIFHSAGDTSEITIKSWGAFKVVVAKTRHKNRKISKSAMIGLETNENLPALYLPDNNQSLKLIGDTKIEGDAYLSERGLERGYIAGKNYMNDKLLYGEQKKSEKYLPKIKLLFQNLSIEKFIKGVKKIDGIAKDTVFEFDQQTSLYSSIDAIYLTNSIKGNIIIHSFDSIYVSSKCILENVILISPKIRFEKGFIGSAQVVAHEQIVCEEDVRLTYPSTLVLNELKMNVDKPNRGIILKKNVQVRGGILLISQASNFRKPIQLKIDEKSLVAGIVFNQGETEIRGKVIGHLYTQSFNLKAGGGEYSNHLLDVLISSDKLPKDFIIPNWLDEEKTGKSKIMSCF